MIDDLLGIQNIGVVSILDFLVGIFELILLSLSFKFIYDRYSTSVSNRHVFSFFFLPFSVSIFLIVVTIKSSLVLSLGLVGALSIIRFRTVVKDTKDTAYIFLALASGMAAGTSSYFLAIAGSLITATVAYILHATNYGSIYSSEFILRFRLKTIDSHEQHSYMEILNSFAKRANLLHIEPSGDSLSTRMTYDIVMIKDKSPNEMSLELSKLDDISELVIVASEHDIDY